jgi:hypothetical protein
VESKKFRNFAVSKEIRSQTTKNNTTMKPISNEQLNEWWNNCSFDEMKEITGYASYEFSDEDGYQDYIDACDEIWNNLTYGEKISAYNKLN